MKLFEALEAGVLVLFGTLTMMSAFFGLVWVMINLVVVGSAYASTGVLQLEEEAARAGLYILGVFGISLLIASPALLRLKPWEDIR
ncbi:MAG: hypothetical protein JKY81_01655 [Colwellia sp.]|nr:hypothetical protein [Colwellia sp.]